MSSRIRFADAVDVFDAFPALARIVARPNGPAEPLAYARQLAKGRPPNAALAYLAHLLPRREAVWWGCQCVGAVLGPAAKDEASRLAQAWVRNPDEILRRDALAVSQAGDLSAPTVWLARAVGHSGGSLAAPDQPPAPPAADACALAVNAAMVLAACRAPPALVLPWIQAFAEAGACFGAGEEARVLAPA